MADTNPNAAPVPIEKSADLEMDGREDFQNLLCQVGGSVEANTVAGRLTATPYFEDVGYLQAEKDGRGFRRSRIPPRRAHGTLQP